MRVLLIQPPSAWPLMDRVFLFEPLALEYLGAGLRLDGHEVRLLDARLDPDVEGALQAFAPDAVGLTGFTSHVNIVRGIAARAKELEPRVAVVVGGHHATVRPQDFLSPHVDAVVIGEGVFAFREILRALGDGGGLSAVKGIAYPAGGSLQFTAPRPYTALDDLPAPDRSLTAAHRRAYFSEWFQPLASVRTSLGCTGRCTFCALWSVTGGKYLRRDPARVVEELKGVAEPNVFFCDDESLCDAARMDRLADLIREAGIRKRYFLYARVDTIVRNPDLLAKWARIGLSQVFVGMEDFSDARLAAMKKGVDTAQQKAAAKILDRLGVMMYASFMVDPDYSEEDFASLAAYVRKLGLKYATFTVMTPLPGTELHEAVKDRLLTSRPELFDMLHALVPTRLPPEEFYEEMAKLYTRAVPFWRTLPTLLRFGLHGMLVRFRVFGEFLGRLRQFHLDV